MAARCFGRCWPAMTNIVSTSKFYGPLTQEGPTRSGNSVKTLQPGFSLKMHLLRNYSKFQNTSLKSSKSLTRNLWPWGHLTSEDIFEPHPVLAYSRKTHEFLVPIQLWRNRIILPGHTKMEGWALKSESLKKKKKTIVGRRKETKSY